MNICAKLKRMLNLTRPDMFFVNHVTGILFLGMLFLSTISNFGCSVRQAIDLPAADEALHNKAVALMGRYDFESAQTVFATLRKRHPDHVQLKVNHAISIINRQREGDETLALNMLKEVLEVQADIQALYCSALLELHMGHLVPALGYFEQVLEREPKNTGALYFTAKTLMQLSRYDDALDRFNAVIRVDPFLRSAYYGKIMTLRQLGNKKAAMENITQYRLIKDNPRSRIMDFKYTKMGELAEVRVPDAAVTIHGEKPTGPLFEPPVMVGSNPAGDRYQGALSVCDINGDGLLDLFFPNGTQDGASLVMLGAKEWERFKAAPEHPLSNIEQVNTALWGDLNDDGNVDVYLCRDGKNQLWMQQDNLGWAFDRKAGTAGRDDLNTVDGILVDADHDGDLDIFLVNANGANELFNNNRDGSFRPLAHDRNLKGNGRPSRTVITRDLDNDRDVDMIVINQEPPHDVYINERLWEYSPGQNYDELIHDPIIAMGAADLDVDGIPELVTCDDQGKLALWKRDEQERWRKSVLQTPPGSGIPALTDLGQGRGSIKLMAADVIGDGRVNLILSHEKGWQVFYLDGHTLRPVFEAVTDIPDPVRNITTYATLNGPAVISNTASGALKAWAPGKGRFDFFQLSLTGRKDRDANLRTNMSGIGTKVYVRIGNQWRAADTFRDHSGPGQSLQPLCIGLNGSKTADFISLEWPDGVLQTEMGLTGNTRHKIHETQRQMSSCPVLFAWDGHSWEFVSDLLGVGGIGYAVGPGVYADPRPWENFMLPQGLIHPQEGRVKLKITEPMEEVEYLDAVSLDVYDLPPGWSMTLDERMGITDPGPTGKPVFYNKAILPIRAVNDRGQEILEDILERDLIAAPVGRLDRRFIGRLQDEHILTIRFERSITTREDPPGSRPVLIMDGWVEYPYSQTSFAAWQANAPYLAPSIDYQDTSGDWHLLWDQMGYPAGMPRQMSVPLDQLPDGVHTLRIRTNQEIYWDRVFVALASECSDVKLHRAGLARAGLEYVGFPRRFDFDQRRPDYDFASKDGQWASRFLEGDYTRFGDVMALLTAKDNALAIYGPGEGVHLEFEIEPEPPVKNTTRVYVLNTHGWCKDMDLYTRTGETVGPVPFEGEVSPAARRLNDEYNIRYRAGRNY